MKLLIMKFSPLPCYLVPLRPKYFPQVSIFKVSNYLLIYLFVTLTLTKENALDLIK
jgi:hypothetical protein